MKIKVTFNPHDIWIGVYWKSKIWVEMADRTPGKFSGILNPVEMEYSMYICILPFFPVKISWKKRLTR